MDQSSIEAWPFESTNRSRLGQIGSCGSKRMTRFQSVYTSGASAIGVPGCPDFACWTASIDRVRMQLIDNSSNCALVIGRDDPAAAVVIASLIFASPISGSCRASLLPRGQQVPAPDPDTRERPEWTDRRRAGARAFQPSRGQSLAKGRAGTG